MLFVAGILAGVGVMAPLIIPHPSPVTSAAHPLAPADSSTPWLVENAPWMWRAGVSFAVAWFVAYLIRAAFKLGLIVAGVTAVILAALQYFGLVDVHWKSLGEQASKVAQRVEDTTHDEVVGLLPSAGAASLGLGSGLLRRRA